MTDAMRVEHLSVIASDIGEAWLECIRKVLRHGSWSHDGKVPIIEVMGLSLRVTRPSASARLIEHVADMSVLDRMIRKFSRNHEMPSAPFTYGSRLYDMNGVDQMEWLVDRLRSKPETKSATVGLLSPGDRSPHIPCLTTLDAKLRDGRLVLQFFFRSQNVLGRQYANLYALSLLQQELASACSVSVGPLSGYIASAHIYEFDRLTATSLAEGKIVRIVDQYYEKGPDSK